MSWFASLSIDFDEKFEEFRKRFKEEKDYKDYLEREKTTEKEIKKDIEKELVINKYLEESIYKDLKPISDEEAKKFYDENPNYFIKPEQVRASHILVSVPENGTEAQKKEARKKAEGILKDLKNGANFEEVAKQKSDCPSKERGGDLGFFSKGRMVKPFEDAAFSLKPGVLSDIVETQYGYHIILVKEHKQEEKIKFEEVKDRIKSFLSDSKKRELIQKRISELTQKAKIEKYLKTESHNHQH
ncbi:MAG: peptidylprolyl isomerase [Thermoanaerobaculia bacterium]